MGKIPLEEQIFLREKLIENFVCKRTLFPLSERKKERERVSFKSIKLFNTGFVKFIYAGLLQSVDN